VQTLDKYRYNLVIQGPIKSIIYRNEIMPTADNTQLVIYNTELYI